VAGQAQDQVGARLAAAAEVVLLQQPQGAEPFAQGTAHPQQPQWIPAGMAGYGEPVEIAEEAVMEIGIKHGVFAL
jgi:hypothetical protein